MFKFSVVYQVETKVSSSIVETKVSSSIIISFNSLSSKKKYCTITLSWNLEVQELNIKD